MNQTSGVEELSVRDVTVKPRQKTMLHFSSGEILTDSESEEEEHELHQESCVSQQGNWTLKERSCFWGTQVFKVSLRICDFLGEKMAGLLGLTAAKYQYAIDRYNRDHLNGSGKIDSQEKPESIHLSQIVNKQYGSNFKTPKTLKEMP
ncbi:protein FAM177A1 [Misgurnus anguillicaudatus]|uniref:protein FAM177A1 n=1 Tax=Misgurnus anguillicaudatus TaxID=75329 RepID=UPI003CCF4960